MGHQYSGFCEGGRGAVVRLCTSEWFEERAVRRARSSWLGVCLRHSRYPVEFDILAYISHKYIVCTKCSGEEVVTSPAQKLVFNELSAIYHLDHLSGDIAGYHKIYHCSPLAPQPSQSQALPAVPAINAGLQYSFSPACVSTHTKLSTIKSSTTAQLLALSQPRLTCNIDTVT